MQLMQTFNEDGVPASVLGVPSRVVFCQPDPYCLVVADENGFVFEELWSAC